MNNIKNNTYEKFRKIIADQNKKIQQQEEKIRRQEEKARQLKQREEEKVRRIKQKERERIQRLKQREQEKREKTLEQVRRKEQRKFQLMREREELMRKRESQAKLKKETQKWEREIKKEEKRQARVLDDLKWKGKKKFRDIRKRLDNKLKKIEKSGKNIRPILISEAIRRNTSKWIIPGGGFKDPAVFLESTTPAVERLINSIDSVGKKVHTVLVCKMVRTNPETGKDTITIAHFSSKSHSMISEEDVKNEYPIMKEKMLESLATYQRLGSGWRLQSVEMLEIFITKFKPLNGKSYKPFPKVIMKKKAVINMENKDNQCFKWAVARALNPVDRDSERITKILKTQAEKYNWNDIEFPTKLKDIHKFENNNNVTVNVFSFDDETKKVYTLRLSKADFKEIINLFLYDEHYSVVKNLSRLVSGQLNKQDHKKHICLRCLNHFKTLESLEKHLELCQNHDHQHHVYPNEDNKHVFFKQYQKMHRVPFVVYADFECFVEPTNNKIGNGTTQYQKHVPSGFCYTIKCMEESIYKDKTVLYTAKEDGEDIGKKFVECLENDLKKVYEILRTPAPIKMSDQEEENFKNVVVCYACGLDLKDDRVRDHCHITGKYRGAAHNKCNLRMKVPKFVPVLFHNLEGYDSHLFVKSLGGEISCIPKTDEKYISFSKQIVMETITDESGKKTELKLEIRFLDSVKFTLKSLDGLVKGLGPNQFKTLENEMGNNELLKKKGVFPYDFMTDFEKLNVNKLPSKKDFYNKLNDNNISDEEYKHAQKVWMEFNCNTMRNYHDLYLKTDVLLLADVMENYRNVCIDNYGLDPLWYYTAPGLAWDAVLKISKIELELLTDPDMYLIIEDGIRGGISTIMKRYTKANNPYTNDFDPEKENTYIQYLDANNLYGWAMSQPLPVNEFKWMNESELQNWNRLCDGKGCILEVDLEYPEDLHDAHNEYPLAPERLRVNKVNKLIPNLNNKEKYVIHHKNLKQYLDLGLKLTKIHKGVKFNEKAWLKDYIQLNTNLRTKGTTDFEKDFFKLMNNSVFGKTMENIRNRIDVRLITETDTLEKLVKKPNFDRINIFTENLVAVHMKKTTIKLHKPIYLGMSILDLSKTLMYDFHYNYIKEKYGENANLLFTDTDSLCYEIKTQDFYLDISNDVWKKFDTSNFDKNHPSGIEAGINKKVIGMIKDEAGGKQITEFVGLRSKLYAYKMHCGKEEKKCKGVKKGVVKKEITLEDYKNCLFTKEEQQRTMNAFRSRKHNIYTESITKTALSANDDKRIILEDGINTMAIGHWKSLSKK